MYFVPITPFGTAILMTFWNLGSKSRSKNSPIFMASRMDHLPSKKATGELSRTACRRPLLRNCSNISGTWVLSGRPEKGENGPTKIHWNLRPPPFWAATESPRNKAAFLRNHGDHDFFQKGAFFWCFHARLNLGYMFGIKDFGLCWVFQPFIGQSVWTIAPKLSTLPLLSTIASIFSGQFWHTFSPS